MRQKNQFALSLGTGAKGEALRAAGDRSSCDESLSRTLGMEAVVESENLNKALARVRHNRGAAGHRRNKRQLSASLRAKSIRPRSEPAHNKS
jgi:hypothetical protein